MALRAIIFTAFILCSSLSYAEDYIVKWGLALPLSGPVAQAGQDIKRGFELALADLENGRVRHELVAEDTRLEQKTAVTAAQKLLSIDKVDIIVALWDTADVVAPIADKHNVVHASIRWNNNIAKKYENTFTFESTYDDYAKKFVELFKKLGFKRISMMTLESPGWNLERDAFLKYAKESGLEIISDQMYSNSSDNSNLLALKALKDKPDIVYVNDTSESLSVIVKSIRKLNKNQRVTGYLGYPMDMSPYEGEYFVAQMVPDPKFEKRFLETYKEPIYIRAHLAYDIMNIVNNVYSQYNYEPSTQQLVEGLKKTESFYGKAGKITATDGGKVFRTECAFMQIKDGKPTLVSLED